MPGDQRGVTAAFHSTKNPKTEKCRSPMFRIPPMLRARPIQWAMRVLLSGLGLYLAFRAASIQDVLTEVLRADTGLLILACATVIGTIGLRAQRWRLLLRLPPSRWWQVVRAILIGGFINVALPFRTGELVRAYLIDRDAGAGRTFALVTVIVEKTLDALVLLLLWLLLLPFAPFAQWIRLFGMSMALGIACPLLLVLFSPRRVQHAASWLQSREPVFRGAPGPIVAPRLLALGLAIADTYDWRLLLAAFVWTTAIWLLSLVMVYLILLAIGLTLPLAGLIFVLLALAVGVVVPALPGRVGTYQAAAVFALTINQVPDAAAVSASVLLYLVGVAVPTILGAAALWGSRKQFGLTRTGTTGTSA